MNTATINASLSRSNARVGQYVTLDPMGLLVRVSDGITSFSATTFQRTATGWSRVC